MQHIKDDDESLLINNVKTSSSKNPNLWKSNIRKQLRQSGLSYIAVNGAERAERTIKNRCPTSCVYRCHAKLDEIDRIEIHKNFWKLGGKEKLKFYAKYVVKSYAARKRTKNEHSRRQFSYSYFFDIGCGKRTQVCQRFFTSTLDINKGRIYHYFDNLKHKLDE